MATTRIIDFGKNKGKVLADCEESYLRWLVSHEKVLAERNRWASRDAKYILDRKAQVTTTVETEGNTNWNEWHQSLQVIAKAPVTDISTKGNLYSNRGFSLMR
jgi:hypothetical protein